MKVFVTVGTTQFDKLFERLSKSDIQLSLKAKGYTEIILQTGTSKVFGPGNFFILVTFGNFVHLLLKDFAISLRFYVSCQIFRFLSILILQALSIL